MTASAVRARSRGAARWRSPWLDPVWAVMVALLAGALLLLLTGHDPVVAYREWLDRGILRPRGLQESIVRATPLLFAGAGVLLALKAGVWNIGVDGQVLAGALATALAATALGDVPVPLMWLGAALAGGTAGAAWAAVPALLRARLGINEIVTSIMFTYIAIAGTSWLVKGPARDPDVVVPQTRLIPAPDRLATFGDTRVHLGLVAALLAAIALDIFLRRTVAGYELIATGASPRAARHGLIPVSRYLALAFIASGAMAALAGVNDVLATKGAFQGEWNPAYGFVAFAVVFLGQRTIPGLVLAALAFGQLSYAADVVPRAADVAPSFFAVIEGTLLVALAVTVWARADASRQMWKRGSA